MRRKALNELLEVVGTTRVVPASAELWTAAAVLGGLRQASNDAHRADRRDRGAQKNAAGDLQGAFGELLVATVLEDMLPKACVQFDALRWEGAGDDVDALVELHGEEFLIETKCHLHEPAKRLFLINADAAERSQSRGARSFVPVISRTGAAVAFLGAPIRMHAVLSWPLRTWSYGDPARSAHLDAVSSEYFDRSYEALLRELERAGLAIGPMSLSAVATTAAQRFAAHRESQRTIARRPREAVSQLSALASCGS